MRIPSVFAIVLVGTAGIASAQPRHEENTERVRYGDLQKGKHDAARDDASWKQLATPTPVKHGTEFFEVGKDQGSFATLRLDADKGRVTVRRVKIYYSNGLEQTADVDRVLDHKHPSADIALKARAPIDRVVVTTEPYGNGEYEIYGSSAEGIATR